MPQDVLYDIGGLRIHKYDVLQICRNVVWLDYMTLRDPNEAVLAVKMVKGEWFGDNPRLPYRIQLKGGKLYPAAYIVRDQDGEDHPVFASNDYEAVGTAIAMQCHGDFHCGRLFNGNEPVCAITSVGHVVHVEF